MCDFFENTSASITATNEVLNTTTGSEPSVMDMPDMDALLDQLEHEEEESERKEHSNANIEIEVQSVQQREEMHKQQDATTSEIVAMEIEKSEEHATSLSLIDVFSCPAPVAGETMNSDVATPEPVDDVFEQIDRMDVLIRVEEELAEMAEVATSEASTMKTEENQTETLTGTKQMASSASSNKENSILNLCEITKPHETDDNLSQSQQQTNDLLNHYVHAMVDRLFEVAIIESQTSTNSSHTENVELKSDHNKIDENKDNRNEHMNQQENFDDAQQQNFSLNDNSEIEETNGKPHVSCLSELIEEIDVSMTQQPTTSFSDTISSSTQINAHNKIEEQTSLETQKDSNINQSEVEFENESALIPLDSPTSDETKMQIPRQQTSESSTIVNDSALAIVHDLSIALEEFKLTESELMLGKRKPYWIPDADCPNCMLCSNRFSLVNRRHHCRACGRVLCRSCCCHRRQLAYMDEREGRQRVCVPCNRTLDRIEEYERRIETIPRTQTGTTKIAEHSRVLSVAHENGQPSTSTVNDAPEMESAGIAHLTNVGAEDFLENSTTNSSSTGVRKTKSLLKPTRLINDTHRLSADETAQPLLSNNGEEEDEEDEKLNQKNTNDENHDAFNLTANERHPSDIQQHGQQDFIQPQSPQQQKRLTSSSSGISTSSNKRSVKFRDGVYPGQEQLPNSPLTTLKEVQTPISPYQWLVSGTSSTQSHSWQNHDSISSTEKHQQSDTVGSADSANMSMPNTKQLQLHSHHGKKLPKKVSRRIKERRMLEEETSLLHQNLGRICAVVDSNKDGTRLGLDLQPRSLDKFVAEIFPDIIDDANGLLATQATIALRRNFHVKCEWRRKFCINQQSNINRSIEVVNFVTNGFNAIGVDELMLALQFDRSKFSNQKDIEHEFFFVLEQFEHIFLNCLNPFEESMDHRMGIRKCASRMVRLYQPLARGKKILLGHPAAAIYFHRPSEQHFADLNCPCGPFLFGTIVREEELPWANCLPCRLLLRLGQQTAQYPTPLVNLLRDQPLFTRDAVQSSVLKVLNDFRNWTYCITHLPGTAIFMRTNNHTEVCLPKLALDEVRTLVESNRNMIGWAINEMAPIEREMNVDSHLVCEQTELDGQFCTRIFSRDPTEQIKATAASFVIFDGALKGGEQFLVSVVEDGLVVRLHADQMQELVKALLSGDSFTASNAHGHQLNVHFVNSNPANQQQQQNFRGALISPIDGRPLDGQFQYGLQLARQLHTFNFFQYTSEWALRLATVINMLPGKWPSALQPRFFDVCEQLAQQVANSVEPFLQELVAVNQLSISLRVQVDDDAVSYETEQWEALPDQHFVWTVTMDELIIPFLYSLCAWVPSGFHVELHMPILSIRPLPAMTILGSPVLPKQKNGNDA